MGFIKKMSRKTVYSKLQLCKRLGLSRSKFYNWSKRYGLENEPVVIPKDYWITEFEKLAAVEFYKQHYEEGYRALAYRMIDQYVASISPSSLYIKRA